MGRTGRRREPETVAVRPRRSYLRDDRRVPLRLLERRERPFDFDRDDARPPFRPAATFDRDVPPFLLAARFDRDALLAFFEALLPFFAALRFLLPPVRLFTVAQPMRSASFSEPPRERTLDSILCAMRFCLPE